MLDPGEPWDGQGQAVRWLARPGICAHSLSQRQGGEGGPPRKSGAISKRRSNRVPDKQEYRTAALRGKRTPHAACVAGLGQGPKYVMVVSPQGRLLPPC